MNKQKQIRNPAGEKLLYAIVYTLMTFFIIVTLYPIVFVISASFSSGQAVSSGRVILWPVDFSFDGYRAVLTHDRLLIGYRNTLFYTIVGTFIRVFVTTLAAYALSRKKLQFKKGYMVLFVLTMYFSGGLIPSYLLMSKIGFVNKIWAMLIPGALGVYYMIIERTFIMSSIPEEMYESAQIDGSSNTRFFFSMVLPLSKAVLAVITLFNAVSIWNSYFSAYIYLNDRNLHPLQIVLREILVMNQILAFEVHDRALAEMARSYADLIKYSMIVVATAPIMCLYPFIQKYFIKGVMVGSLKG